MQFAHVTHYERERKILKISFFYLKKNYTFQVWQLID